MASLARSFRSSRFGGFFPGYSDSPLRSVIPRRAPFSLLLAVSLLPTVACGRTTSLAPPHGRTRSAAQALRTCVDRWNQENMVDWGPGGANVAVRRLDASERTADGLRGDARQGCVVSLISDRGTVACAIARFSAYWCPPLHDTYGPPLKKNAT